MTADYSNGTSPFSNTNSRGITSPSTTAGPLMHTEGFVDETDPQVTPPEKEVVTNPAKEGAGTDQTTEIRRRPSNEIRMSHVDEFTRDVPEQRSWEL